MIAAWMLYATAVAAVLGLAALAAERALALYRLPARHLWLAAMAVGFSLPLLALGPWPGARGDGALAPVIALPAVWAGPADTFSRVGELAASLDAVLLAGWAVTSLVILIALGASLRRLRRERGRWTRRAVAGRPVLVSPDLGPALVGLSPGAIVIPEWFLELPAETQRLAMLHEQEHLEAGDTRFLALGVCLAALSPWNPALWWQVRRLRAAVELDCDTRVLAAGVHPGGYANALLQVGERSRPAAFPLPALAESRSMLSRRVGAMFTKRIKRAWLRAAGYGAAAAVLLVVACEAPAPDRGAEDPTGVPAGAAAAGEVFAEGAPGIESPERLSFPTPAYPRLLFEAGVEGTVVSRFIVGTDGRVEAGSVEIVESTNRAFEAPTRHAIEIAVFRPGRMNGEAVRVRVQMPLRFTTQPPPGPVRIAR